MARGSWLLRYEAAPMMAPPIAVVPLLNCLGTAIFSAAMMARVTVAWAKYAVFSAPYVASTSRVSCALRPVGRCWPGLGESTHGVADLSAYSAGCSASPRKPHSSDCAACNVSSLSNNVRSRARIFACVGRGRSGGRVPMTEVAVSWSISYDGGMTAAAMAAGGTTGAAACAAAAAAAASAAAVACRSMIGWKIRLRLLNRRTNLKLNECLSRIISYSSC